MRSRLALSGTVFAFCVGDSSRALELESRRDGAYREIIMGSLMTTQAVAAKLKTPVETKVNDFTIQVATANGSGSQSSNAVLMRAIFQMGIPVSGKNLFPSNIQSLPTWFTIRANKNGYSGLRKDVDILVCMNPETALEDVKRLQPGAVCFYDAPLRLNKTRSDVTFYEIPFAKLAMSVPNVEARIRKLLANMCYVGVLGELLNLDFAECEKAISKQFKGKEKAVSVNVQAMKVGADYARNNLPKLEKFRLERMNENGNKIIIDGNAAAAMGCVMAGCTVVGWYPITPSTSLCESFISYAKKHRREASGKATYASIQCEDELASVGLVLGAGWTGARSMTATSGPGLSLMAEFVGMGYYTEIPAVIFDVQRAGPSTGLPTRTLQGDVQFAATLSHGDTKHICLYPANMLECYQLAQDAFDLAEQFQTPVLVLTDLDLGMNNWVSDRFPYPTKPIQRGKVLDEKQLEELRAAGKTFERYRDVDGDGIPYRTLPGTNHPMGAYFTRGSGHNEKAQYSERPEDWVNNLDRLAKKFETARSAVPQPIFSGDESADVGLIAYGSTDEPMQEAMDQLSAQGVRTQYMRIRAFPFTRGVHAFIQRKKRVYVIEQNRDGQMLQLLKCDIPADQVVKLRSVRSYDGLPVAARTVSDAIFEQEMI